MEARLNYAEDASIATGATGAITLGPVPDGWILRSFGLRSNASGTANAAQLVARANTTGGTTLSDADLQLWPQARGTYVVASGNVYHGGEVRRRIPSGLRYLVFLISNATGATVVYQAYIEVEKPERETPNDPARHRVTALA